MDLPDPPSAQHDDTAIPRPRDILLDLRLVAIFYLVAISIAFIVTLVAGLALSPQDTATLILWACAMLAAGGGIGFLFGIPKVLQATQSGSPAPSTTGAGTAPGSSPASNASQPPAFGSYRQKVNTNLEEISDWLTKIIVGIGLVQLKSIPGYCSRLADQVQGSMSDSNHHSLALAVIVFFAINGFMFTYLITRLYIQGALARAESSIDAGSDPSPLRGRFRLAEQRSLVNRSVSAISDTSIENPKNPSGQVDPTFEKLANNYVKANGITDYSARQEAKNKVAADIYQHLLGAGISRDAVASKATNAGFLVALATAAARSPESGDVARLLKTGSLADSGHVKARVALAFNELARQHLIQAADKGAVSKLLDDYKQGSAADLQDTLAAVQSQLRDQP